MAIGAALIVSACSGAPPRIVDQSEKLIFVDNRTLETRYEQLSVFVQAEDQNGIDDIQDLYVINDKAGLYWTFTPDTWETRQSGGSTWIGSSSIVMADYSAIPRGEYRVVVVDLAGTRDERQFAVAAPKVSLDTIAFPKLTIAGSDVTTSTTPVDIMAKEQGGSAPVLWKTLNARSAPIASLLGHQPSPGQQYLLYATKQDPETGVELLSGPFTY